MPSFGLRTIVALLVVAATAAPSLGDNFTDPPEAVSLLAKGKRLLREGDWHQASKIFEELAGRYPNSENLDQFVFYRAKAKYYAGRYYFSIRIPHFVVKNVFRAESLNYCNLYWCHFHYLLFL